MIPTLQLAAGAALLSAVLAFGGAWKIQSYRMDSLEHKYNDDIQKAKDATAAVEGTIAARVTEATAAAARRGITIRRSADAARSELDRLRNVLSDNQRRRDENPSSAGTDGAATGEAILGECAGAYQELARKADGHASDVKQMTEAWPRP